MPWLSDEVPDWQELSDEEREEFREGLRTLGMEFPSDDEDDDDYYE